MLNRGAFSRAGGINRDGETIACKNTTESGKLNLADEVTFTCKKAGDFYIPLSIPI